MQTKITIVILNFNSSQFTIDCIKSIASFDCKVSYNILIFDNGSNQEDYKKLLQLKSSNVDVIRNEENLGFASGNMEAIKNLKTEYIFFLNNDTLFYNNVLDPLFEFCEENPTAGICAPQLFNQDDTLHATFDYFPTLATKIFGVGFVKLFSRREFHTKDLIRTNPLKVELVSGSAMFVRKSAFDRIGGFDKTFFLYCEEEDLALRMNKNNFDVFLVPTAKVKHIGGGSTGRNLLLEKEFYISFNYFYKKHYGLLKALIIRLFLFLKIAKKYKRDRLNWELAKFILSNPSPDQSIRFRK